MLLGAQGAVQRAQLRRLDVGGPSSGGWCLLCIFLDGGLLPLQVAGAASGCALPSCWSRCWRVFPGRRCQVAGTASPDLCLWRRGICRWTGSGQQHCVQPRRRWQRWRQRQRGGGCRRVRASSAAGGRAAGTRHGAAAQHAGDDAAQGCQPARPVQRRRQVSSARWMSAARQMLVYLAPPGSDRS